MKIFTNNMKYINLLENSSIPNNDKIITSLLKKGNYYGCELHIAPQTHNSCLF